MHQPPHFEHHEPGPAAAAPVGAAPWPRATHPGQHAPTGAARAPQQRFQYSSGFVVPGAPQGQPRLSAHHGTIGVPQAPPAAADRQPWTIEGGGAVAPPQQQHHQHPAPAPAAAWGFATPSGLQLVQHPGAPQRLQGAQPLAGDAAHAPVHAAGDPSEAPVRNRRRVRWETIVPTVAVACVAAAATLFVSDFERIMGGRGDSPGVSAQLRGEPASDSVGAAGGGIDQDAQVIDEAQARVASGQFEEAIQMLEPLLATDEPPAAATRLHDRAVVAAARTRRLLGQLERQRRAGNWGMVAATLDQLERLRPLAPAQQRLERRASAILASGRALARARALMARGRDDEALRVVERALGKRKDRRLEALREQLSARRAAPSRPNRAAGAPVAGGAHGAHGSGAAGPVGTTARPPASVPAGSIPARPDIPNPVSTPAGGAAAVAGAGAGGATSCHVHGGVRECH